MPSPSDREPTILEQQHPAFPLPPLNVGCVSFDPEVVDVLWTPPAELSANTNFNVLGVNIYRSFDSEFGPFFRLNTIPLGSLQYRDTTKIVLAIQEDVSSAFTTRGAPTDVALQYAFRTRYKPIVIHPSPGAANRTNLNVQVTVNGIPAYVEEIHSEQGIVILRHLPTFDSITKELTPPVLPTSPTDVVLATYRYIKDEVRTKLSQKIFYRITTVAYDAARNELIETPLDRAVTTNNMEVEKIDYIWAEAVRRNKWILFQGGERVKLFIRKIVGPQCGCNSVYHRQPDSQCLVCFNTGVIGGYDGPYNMIIAPDDAEKKHSQTNRGRTVEHSYETWTGPRPLLSQRDFIVKLNGDRYGIGPVRMPSNRGMQLQQMFSISSFDEADIRFKVLIPNLSFMDAPREHPPGRRDVLITDRQGIADERELRGNSITWSNNVY
ncbi:MAG TPA: hypothetical protein VIE65_08550 [Methylobacter sp.]|jgi:hypothetical protein